MFTSLLLSILACPSPTPQAGADFALSVSPSSQVLVPGNSIAFTVSTTALNGFSAPVALSASPAIAGVSYGFAPNPVAVGSSSVLSLDTTLSATPGTHSVTVSGVSQGITRTKTVTVVIDPYFPERTHQPGLMDPGLHGGRIHSSNSSGDIKSFDGQGDTTPDGRVFIGLRVQKYAPPSQAPSDLWAVVATAVDVDRIQVDDHRLEAFYSPVDLPGAEEFGEDFAFASASEAKVIYWLPPFTGAETPEDFDDDKGPMHPVLPLPQVNSANIAVAMRRLPDTGPENGENPYPSDSNGTFQIDGSFRTYKIRLITEDNFSSAGADTWTCTDTTPPLDPSTLEWHDFNSLGCEEGGTEARHRLVALDVDVTLDVSGPAPVVSRAVLVDLPADREGLCLKTTTGDYVFGVEPSITADGTLIVFHGPVVDEVPPYNEQTDQRTTYVWHPDGMARTDWSAPRSVTRVPPSEFSGDLDAFARLYGFAKYPIREADGEAYAPGDMIFGAYPWVSKDGSFFAAMHVKAIDAHPSIQFRRAGMFVCGNITGGYIKHVDDQALNPTRYGGSIYWPQPAPGMFKLDDTGRTTIFSTGMRPGLWEPFLGDGLPVPSHVASQRIPVLPFFVHRTRQYGEVRFEEADGNYLLYLACNESFERGGTASACNLRQCKGSHACTNFVTTATPDTSGRALRATCTLNAGAAFPQDVEPTTGSEADRRAAIRQRIGAAIGASGQPLHENVGYKGQAIVFNMDGRVQVNPGTHLHEGVEVPNWDPYEDKLTIQTFVKLLPGFTSGALVEDPNRFLLRLNADGSVTARVKVKHTSTPLLATKEVTSPPGLLAIGLGDPLANPGESWRHLTMTYDGSLGSPAKSRLELFADGLLMGATEWSWPSRISLPPSTTLYVGPGRTATPNQVDFTNAALVLDEVAISSVVRTIDEIRRDAYVPLGESPFAEMPATIALPVGLERSETRWPQGLLHSQQKVDLGRDLFESTRLSLNEDRSCSDCHLESAFFADGQTRATAEVGGADLPFNVPTAYNMVFGTHKMFDGSAGSVEEQVTRPITGAEMGPLDMTTVLDRVKATPVLKLRFSAAYQPLPSDGHINEENFREALAMYVRVQLSGGSAFDQDGELRKGGAGVQLDPAAHRGRSLFFGKARCFGCHRGSNFSDDDFHNIGSVKPTEGITVRSQVTLRASEDGMVKTPTLRNVAQTGPYFHDGSMLNLGEVIDHYNGGFATSGGIGTLDRQLRPLELTPAEKADLESFLQSLTEL